MDWIEDEDGCPEVERISLKLNIKVDNCNTGPCQYIDYSSPFMPWMNIKAFLVNPNNPYEIYRISNSKTIPY